MADMSFWEAADQAMNAPPPQQAAPNQQAPPPADPFWAAADQAMGMKSAKAAQREQELAPRVEQSNQWAAQKNQNAPVQVMGVPGWDINLGKEVGSETLGGVGVSAKDILRRSVPGTEFQGKEETKRYGEAKKAYDEYLSGKTDDKPSDAQLGRIAEYEYDQQREAARSQRSKIAAGAIGVPKVLGEFAVAGPAISAAGGVLGSGWAATALATPLMPEFWLQKSQERANKNGGNWYDPKNVSVPLAEAAVQNVVLGQVAKFAGAAADATAKSSLGQLGVRAAVGAAAMPLESTAAETLTSTVQAALSETKFAKYLDPEEEQFKTFRDVLAGKWGDVGTKLATDALMGAGFSAFHGKEPNQVEALTKAGETLKKSGLSDEGVAKALQDAVSKPPGDLPKGPVRDYVESAHESAKDAIKSSETAAEPPTAQTPAGQEIAAQPKPQEAEVRPDESREGVYKLHVGGEPVGEVSFGPQAKIREDRASGTPGDAKTMFPDVVKPGESVARINGIEIAGEQRNKGLGQKLYLESMNKEGADWYYNSQSEPAATRALTSLADKGLIDLHWKGRPGGIHLVRLTEKGRQAAGSEKVTPEIGSYKDRAESFQKASEGDREAHLVALDTDNMAGLAKKAGPEAAKAFQQQALGIINEELSKAGEVSIHRAGSDAKSDEHSAIITAPKADVDAALKRAEVKIQALGQQFGEVPRVSEKEGPSRPGLTSFVEPIKKGSKLATVDQEAGLGIETMKGRRAFMEGNHSLQTKEANAREKLIRSALSVEAADGLLQRGEAEGGLPSEARTPARSQAEGDQVARSANPQGDQASTAEAERPDAQGPQVGKEKPAVMTPKEAMQVKHLTTDDLKRQKGDWERIPGEHLTLEEAATAAGPSGAIHLGDTGRRVEVQNSFGGTQHVVDPRWVAYKKAGAEEPAVMPPTGEPSKTTGPKNATVDQELASMGLPPAEHGMGTNKEEVWQAAKSRLAADPHAGQKLVEELAGKMRPVTPEEIGVLTLELNRRITERDKAEDAINNAKSDADKATSRIQAATAKSEYAKVADVVTKAGTLQAQAFGMRKMMVNRDFSLVAMERSREASKGSPLNDKESAEVKSAHQKIQELQNKIAENETANRRKRLEKFDQEPNRVRSEKAKGEVDAAWDNFKKVTSGKLFSTPFDPEMIGATVRIAKAYLRLGVAKVADFIAAVRQRIGRDLKPGAEDVLNKAWDQANHELAMRRVELSAWAATQQPETPEAVSRLAKILYRQFAETGVHGMDARLDATHKALLAVDPSMSRDAAMDAVSGYGIYKPLSKEALAVEIRDQQGQMQQLGKLRDLESGKPPKKTGVERREPSAEERALQRKVEAKKKELGIETTDPEKQLKSALDSTKTRLRNETEKMTGELLAGKQEGSNRTKPQSDAELENLKNIRDITKTAHDAAFPPKPLPPEVALKRATDAAEKLATAWKERAELAKAGWIPGKDAAKVHPPEVEAIRAKAEAWKAEYDALKAPRDKEARLRAYYTDRIAELKDKVAKGDFAQPERTEPVRSPELQKLRAELAQIQNTWKEGNLKLEAANRPTYQKVMAVAAKWRRGAILSSPITLAKLTSAAIERTVFTPMQNLVGYGVGKLLPRLAAKATLEGGFSAKVEAKAFTEGWMKWMGDAKSVWKTGDMDIGHLYGDKHFDVDPSFADYFGRVHYMLKTPAKRAAFERAMMKGTEAAIKEGLDPTDPDVQMRLGVEAYKASERSIFQQDNVLTDMWKRAINITPETKFLGDMALPIVRVPTNIVLESLNHAFGSVIAPARLALKGVEKLKPAEADSILRQFKQGFTGLGMLALGYYLKDEIGGYYDRNDKRKEGDVGFGEVRMFGWRVPSYLVHNPLLEMLQLGATIARASEKGKVKSTTVGVAKGLLGLAEETPFVRESLEVSKAAEGDVQGVVGGQLRSLLVPAGAQWIAGNLDKNTPFNPQEDPIQRTAEGNKGFWHGIRQQVQKGVPVAREELPKAKK